MSVEERFRQAADISSVFDLSRRMIDDLTLTELSTSL